MRAYFFLIKMSYTLRDKNYILHSDIPQWDHDNVLWQQTRVEITIF